MMIKMSRVFFLSSSFFSAQTSSCTVSDQQKSSKCYYATHCETGRAAVVARNVL